MCVAVWRFRLSACVVGEEAAVHASHAGHGTAASGRLGMHLPHAAYVFKT